MHPIDVKTPTPVTETSNTATTELLLPLLASVASATDVHPLLLMIPATLSASCAFMMPVATPPNAIVFGSGRLRIGDMVKVGIVLNLVGIAVITLLFLTLGRAVFDIPTEGVPDWAAGSKSPAAHSAVKIPSTPTTTSIAGNPPTTSSPPP